MINDRQYTMIQVNILQPVEATSMRDIMHSLTANPETLLMIGSTSIEELTDREVQNLRESMGDL